jgi:hypothetical protein
VSSESSELLNTICYALQYAAREACAACSIFEYILNVPSTSRRSCALHCLIRFVSVERRFLSPCEISFLLTKFTKLGASKSLAGIALF